MNDNERDKPDEDEVAKVREIAEKIRPLLAGHGSRIQGVALATLVATWLKGHIHTSDREKTIDVRARLLAHFTMLCAKWSDISHEQVRSISPEEDAW